MSKCRTCQYDSEAYNFICKSCIHQPMIGDHYRPVSNADHIRAMTDEELVDFFRNWEDDPKTSRCDGFTNMLRWFQQPYESEGTPCST